METFADPTARHSGDLDALCVAAQLGDRATFEQAHRTARDIRIARIHRLHSRASRNFREAHFAYQCANSTRDAALTLSADRAQAHRLCAKALRQMEHWHKRSRDLARMEIQLSLKPLPGGLDAC